MTLPTLSIKMLQTKLRPDVFVRRQNKNPHALLKVTGLRLVSLTPPKYRVTTERHFEPGVVEDIELDSDGLDSRGNPVFVEV